MQKIQNKGRIYLFLKHIVNFGIRSYFGFVCVKGKENLPKGQSYIMAPNHQNAFLDALSILYLNKNIPTVYLARADIFANPVAKKILTFLKIMPIYRARDGKKSLSQNDEIFNKSIDVLLDKIPFCMMAEGTHNNRRQLLPFRKGMFRIAFATQEQLGTEPIFIIPIGIDYEDYTHSGCGVVVNIGKPICVQDFMNVYGQNNALAINNLLTETRKQLALQMHQINSKENYDIFYKYSFLSAETSCKNYLSATQTAWKRFEQRQIATQMLEKRLLENPNFISTITNETKNLETKSKASTRRNIVKSLILIAILGASVVCSIFWSWDIFWTLVLACPIPFLPTHLLFCKNDDTQFIGSLNFFVQFFLSIIYIITITTIFCLTKGLLHGLIIFLCGIFVWRWGSSLCYRKRL